MTAQSSVRTDRTPRTSALHWAVSIVMAAGLFVDAAVHVALAPKYDVVVAAISEGMLFRLQAGVAVVAGVLVLVLRRRLAYAFALLVAGTAVAALLISTYVHVGAIGAFPDMFEPTWFASKRLAVFAESAAVLAAAVGIVLPPRPPRPPRDTSA